MSKLQYIFFLLMILLVSGCSRNLSNPAAPLDTGHDIPEPFQVTEHTVLNHNFLGSWIVSLDETSLKASTNPNRAVKIHWNVKDIIPPPGIVVNSWDPVNEIIDVDVMINNPYFLDVYDVRLIIYSDDAGHWLLNHDGATPLFDIPGGLNVNPFKAYAKHNDRRRFGGTEWYQENLRIHCPDNNFVVQFAIDASYPGNCEEPCMINAFHHGMLTDTAGSSTTVYLDVHDWQNDVDQVQFVCPAINGIPVIEMNHSAGNTWEVELVNNMSAPPGEYEAFAIAGSLDSGSLKLYNQFIVRITNQNCIPLDPEIVGYIQQNLHRCYDVFIENGYLYAIDYLSGLNILDISNPLNPRILGNVEMEYPLNSAYVSVDEDYACVVFAYSDYSGMKHTDVRIVDVSNPYNPEITGFIELDSYASGVCVSGKLAYIVGGEFQVPGFLRVINFSDPLNPSIIGEITLTNRALDVALAGNFVYITTDDIAQLRIYNISSPSAPEFISKIDIIGATRASAVLLMGDYALVAIDSSVYASVGVESIDISDPHNPESVSYVGLNALTWENVVWDLAVSGDYAFAPVGMVDYNEFNVINVSDPTNLYLVNTITGAQYISRMVGYEDWIFYTRAGLGIIDSVDPYNLEFHTAFDEVNIQSISVKDDYVICTDVWNDPNSTRIVDISDPSNPAIVNTLDIGEFNSVDICGDYAYLVGENLTILDISDNPDPELISSTQLAHIARAITVKGNHAYILSKNAGLNIFDVSNPSNPFMTGSLSLVDSCEIAHQDNYVYITVRNDGLYVVAVSNPQNPLILGSVELDCRGVDVQGDYVYCSNIFSPFSVIDVSNPANPVLISQLDDLHSGEPIRVSGSFAYIDSYAIDIIDPYNPLEVSSFYPSGIVSDIEIIDNHAFYACHMEGMKIYKLWD